jgi:O-antigen ligase
MTFPLGVAIRVSLSPQVYVYPVDIAVVITGIVGLYMLIVQKKRIMPKILVILLSIALLSLIVNATWLSLSEWIVSSMYLVRLIFYLLLIPVVSQLFSRQQKIQLHRALIGSIFMTVLFGFLQYVLYPNLRNLQYLGWDEHLYRIFSTFLDPNFASAIFVLLFWITAGYLARKHNRKWEKYLAVAIMILTSIAIVTTYSRTGLVMFGVSLVVYSVLKRQLTVLAISLVLLVLSIIFLPKDLQSEGVNLLRTASIYSRFEAYKDASAIVQKNPILGIGFNAYRYAQVREDVGGAKVMTSHAGAGVSNSYLFILATTGIVGFLMFIYAVIVLLRNIAIDKKLGAQKYSVLAMCSAILVGSLTENILFYSFVLIILAMYGGIVVSLTDDR